VATRLAEYADPIAAISRAFFSIASALGPDGICTIIATVAARLRSTAFVAVTFTDLALVTVGAVKRPLGEIVPVLALQITPVLTVLAKLAVNCRVDPDETTALAGNTVGAELFVFELFPVCCAPETEEQLAVASINTSSAKSTAL
jgi:hypothetical protein